MKKVDFDIDNMMRLLDADRVPSYSTIGSAAPVGICGTGSVPIATCRFS